MKINKKYLIETIKEVIQEYSRDSNGLVDRTNDKDQLSQVRNLKKAAERLGLEDTVKDLQAMETGLLSKEVNYPENQFYDDIAAIADEIQAAQSKKPNKKEGCQTVGEYSTKLLKAAGIKAAQIEAGEIGSILKGETFMASWGSILDLAAGILGESQVLTEDPGTIAAIAWSALPAIFGRLVVSSDESWGQKDDIKRHPFLDKLDLDEGYFDIFQDDIIEDIAAEYIDYMRGLPSDTCVDDMVNVDLFFKNKIKANPGYQRIMKESLLENEEDLGYLQKLFSLVASGNVEQAFDLADSLDMEKELVQTILKNTKDTPKGHTILDVSDDAAVALLDYFKEHPDVDLTIKDWLSFGLPFKKPGPRLGDPLVIDYNMYRGFAYNILKDIVKKLENNDLNEENFGRESRGDILAEGWKDQWPAELKDILLAIQSTIPDPFHESVANIFLRTANISEIMPVRFVRAISNQIKILARGGINFQTQKIRQYEQQIKNIKAEPTIDFPQENKDEDIAEIEKEISEVKKILSQYEAFYALADDPFYFGRNRRKEVLKQSRYIGDANPNSNMPSMRYINKTIKSMRKQLTKWREKNTDGFPRLNVAVGSTIQYIDTTTSNLVTRVFDKFEDDMRWLFRFLKSVRGSGEDTAKKLASMLKKNKDLPMDEYIEEIKKFSLQNNKDYFNDCDDVPDGDPCVFLKLDNGMFWHSTETDYCDITQVEMNNCGSASESGSILYNLMSTSEGGTQRYHVTLEYNEEKNQVVQVLGQANTLPKEKYWSSIAEFFNAMGDPELNKDAFVHLYGGPDDNEALDQEIEAFIQGIGARTKPRAAFRTWEAMKEQIRDGYYSEKIETFAPINNQTNLFRASLSYSGMTGPVDRPGSAAMITLTLQVILQTKEEDKAEEWRKANPNIFREAREFGKSQEFKQLLYNAIPERLTRANRLDIKYSKISNPRLRLGGMGNYKMRMRMSFKIDVRSWNESKGELLVMRFQELLKDTLRDLPGQAMLVFLAVEGKGKTNEGKKKLDRNYLTSMILEVLNEKPPYHDLMLDFDNPEHIIHGVYMFAISELEIFVDGKHQFEGIVHDPFAGGVIDQDHGQDEYIFEVESKQKALRLQEALRDFYKPVQRKVFEEIYISADWYDGPPRVMMDIPK